MLLYPSNSSENGLAFDENYVTHTVVTIHEWTHDLMKNEIYPDSYFATRKQVPKKSYIYG